MKNKYIKVLIYLGITVVINITFQIVSRSSADFSEWYAFHFYPVLGGIAARITGIFPFAAVEILLYVLILAVISGIVIFIIKLVKGKGRRIRVLITAALTVACTVSTLMVMFLFGCGINYHRRTFAEHSGFNVELYSAEDLKSTLLEVIGELNKIAPYVNTAENGGFAFDRNNLHKTARNSMQKLGETYPALDVYYPNPKPVLLSEQFLSRMLIGGVFSPFTIEALYNRKMTDSEIPFTIVHELAHLAGFMREDEANFIAFLACRESGEVDFIYSGYITALIYLLNAYYNVADDDDYMELTLMIPEQVRIDLALRRAYWEPFRNTPVSQAVSAVNDTYLKAQGQHDGVQSYGRLVDLLIAEHLSRFAPIQAAVQPQHE
jgi:hypothetical protein